MSRQDARSFVERVANDAEFRRLVSPLAESRDVERVIAIGAEHGLRFTASELDEAAKEQRFGSGTREVSDSQLDGVTGGKLLEAAVKGKVFKKVEIHGTATYGDAGEQVYLDPFWDLLY